MTVFVACYKGTETDEILGVFRNLENAQKAIHKDYERRGGEWYNKWYIVETILPD